MDAFPAAHMEKTLQTEHLHAGRQGQVAPDVIGGVFQLQGKEFLVMPSQVIAEIAHHPVIPVQAEEGLRRRDEGPRALAALEVAGLFKVFQGFFDGVDPDAGHIDQFTFRRYPFIGFPDACFDEMTQAFFQSCIQGGTSPAAEIRRTQKRPIQPHVYANLLFFNKFYKIYI